jgi:hypothetical protein
MGGAFLEILPTHQVVEDHQAAEIVLCPIAEE